jgi:hypothetical protein
LSAIDPSFENLRTALMNSYNSQIIAHAGYIIALTVGLLSIISRWDELWGYFRERKIKKWLFAVFLSAIIGFIWYFFLRVVYWATLSDQVMLVSFSDLHISEQSPTYIAALQNAAVDNLKDAGTRNILTKMASITKDYFYVTYFFGFFVSLIFLYIILWKKDWLILRFKKGIAYIHSAKKDSQPSLLRTSKAILYVVFFSD